MAFSSPNRARAWRKERKCQSAVGSGGVKSRSSSIAVETMADDHRIFFRHPLYRQPPFIDILLPVIGLRMIIRIHHYRVPLRVFHEIQRITTGAECLPDMTIDQPFESRYPSRPFTAQRSQ